MTKPRGAGTAAALALLALLLLATSSHSYVGAQSLVASTKIGGDSVYGMVYDSGKGEMFVSAQDFLGNSNSILVLSETDDAVVANISLGSDTEPGAIAYDAAKGEIFVVNSSGSNVLVISDATDKVTATISGFTDGPASLAYDPANGEIFVGTGLIYGTPGTVFVLSDSTNSVVATVQVGEYPDSMAYDPTLGEMFVAAEGEDAVQVISDSNDSVVATVNVGDGPSSIVYDSAKGEVFVADTKQNAVSVISDATNSVVATITSSDLLGPTGMAYDPTTGEVFVGNQGNVTTATNDVSVISDATDSVTGVVDAGIPGTVLGYDPAKGEVFVGNDEDSYIDVFSVGASQITTTASFSISSSSTNSVQATSSNSLCFYYNLNASATVSTYTCLTGSYDTVSGRAGPGEIGVGPYPIGMAYDSAKGEVYVVDADGPAVSVISDATNSVVATIYIPGVDDLNADAPSPSYIAYDPAKGELFVSNPDCISVISDTSNTVVATIDLGNTSENRGAGVVAGPLVYDSARGEIFVAEEGAETTAGSYPNTTTASSGVVSVISDSTDTVVDTIPVGDFPNAIAYDPSRGEIFVANYGKTPNDTSASNVANGSVSVISDSNDTVVDTIPIAAGPRSMAYDSARGEMFVSCAAGSVSVISDATNSVVATIPTGSNPEGIAYDQAQGEIFVANDAASTASNASAYAAAGGSVSVISDTSNSVLRTIPEAQTPLEVLYDSATGSILLSNSFNDTVTVISSSTASSTTSSKSSSSTLAPSYLAILGVDAAVLAVVGGSRLGRAQRKALTAILGSRSASLCGERLVVKPDHA